MEEEKEIMNKTNWVKIVKKDIISRRNQMNPEGYLKLMSELDKVQKIIDEGQKKGKKDE